MNRRGASSGATAPTLSASRRLEPGVLDGRLDGCGAGTLYGNGGPMQTLGYMDGQIEVAWWPASFRSVPRTSSADVGRAYQITLRRRRLPAVQRAVSARFPVLSNG